jgi:hypothetical protein
MRTTALRVLLVLGLGGLADGSPFLEFRSIPLRQLQQSGCLGSTASGENKVFASFRGEWPDKVELLVRPHFAQAGKRAYLGRALGAPLVWLPCGPTNCHTDDAVVVPLKSEEHRALVFDLLAGNAYAILQTSSGNLCFQSSLQDSITANLEGETVLRRAVPSGMERLGAIQFRASAGRCNPELAAGWRGRAGSRLEEFVWGTLGEECTYRAYAPNRYRLAKKAPSSRRKHGHGGHGIYKAVLRLGNQRLELEAH